jgi:hypothetical protein
MSLTSFINSPWFIPLIIWSLIWKGIALWKSGRHNQLYWFIALLVVNTIGILEIAYLVFFQPKNKKYVDLRRK